jgi:plasmid stabilization system protein ParE
MFAEHVKFLKRESSNAARRLVLSFNKSTARIADNPFQFPVADELDVPDTPPNTYKKCLFEKRYKALFLVRESIVYVIAVIDTRRENKDLFM